MDTHYRKRGVVFAIIFSTLCVPIVLTNTLMILFSYMASPFPWQSYAALGPAIIFALLTAFFSIRSVFFATPRLFIVTETTLVLTAITLVVMFPLYGVYAFFAVCYSVSGILQINRFWRYSSCGITERYFKPAVIVMAITTLITCANLGYIMMMAVPKLPLDKKIIKFTGGSLNFYDDQSRELFFGQLAEDQVIQGILFPKHTWIYFYESGKLMLAKPPEKGVTVQGIRCAGNDNVSFYESGRLHSAGLASDQDIGGKTYHTGEFLYFNEDGSVSKSYGEE